MNGGGAHDLEESAICDMLDEMRALRSECNEALRELRDMVRMFGGRIPAFSEILANQLLLAQPGTGEVMVYARVQGNSRGLLRLFRTEEGLCFVPPDPGNGRGRKIFANTIPKFGSTFIKGALRLLGFSYVGIAMFDESFLDARFGSRIYYLPYLAQTRLILPGQYAHGHIRTRFIKEAHGEGEIFLGVRDLRHALVFDARYGELWNAQAGCAALEEALYAHCHSSEFEFFLSCCADMTDLLSHCRLVRHEELCAEGLTASHETIALVTGCRSAEVVDAFGKAGAEGKGVQPVFADVWSDRLERLFQARGLDAVNERFGYDRECLL